MLTDEIVVVFPPQTKVKCQVGPNLPVILHVESKGVVSCCWDLPPDAESGKALRQGLGVDQRKRDGDLRIIRHSALGRKIAACHKDEPGAEKIEVRRLGQGEMAVIGPELKSVPAGYDAQIIFHLGAVLDVSLISSEICPDVDGREDNLWIGL